MKWIYGLILREWLWKINFEATQTESMLTKKRYVLN